MCADVLGIKSADICLALVDYKSKSSLISFPTLRVLMCQRLPHSSNSRVDIYYF